MIAFGVIISFKVILSLTKPSKDKFWTSKMIFNLFDPSKILLFVPNSLFPPVISLPIL